MFRYQKYAVASLVILAGLITALAFGPGRGGFRRERGPVLTLFCAAGVREPIREVIERFERETGATVEARFAGSGVLLSSLRLEEADLYLAADRGYLEQAQERGLTTRIVPFARQHPVIAVRTGNPHQIQSLADLTREKIRVTLPDPERAAIGRIAKALLESQSHWEPIWRHAILQRATVNDVANDVKLESADAGVVWNTTAAQYPELDAVEIPDFKSADSEIGIAVLKTSQQAELTQRFIDELLDPEIGQQIFARYGYDLISHEQRKVTP
ncbi:MAG: molybdate ABC transporter substrate-binding protein [Planctomycetaceae bacterium]|nr:molybdate ABC transporter substrate-binding protein [Planctomycetaceae bacterium]